MKGLIPHTVCDFLEPGATAPLFWSVARKLKVYRTPMGFYDAVVAAPNQGAALRAWGVTTNLFAEGLAETVSREPELEAEALRSPGVIIRRPRGDTDELLARSPPKRFVAPSIDPGKSRRLATGPRSVSSPPGLARAPSDRSKLAAAEKAVREAEADLAEQLAAIRKSRLELEAQEHRLQSTGKRRIEAAQAALRREREALKDAP